MIITDWVVGWDSVQKKWYKLHVTIDTEKVAQFYLKQALANKSLKVKTFTQGVGIEVIGDGVCMKETKRIS